MHLKLIKSLLYLKCLIWLALAIFYYTSQVSPNPDITFEVVAFLLFINAAIYFLLARFWNIKNKIIYWITIVFIGANIVLTITDNMGIIDYASLITDAIILSLIFVKSRQQNHIQY